MAKGVTEFSAWSKAMLFDQRSAHRRPRELLIARL
jgi:hypothetical protein